MPLPNSKITLPKPKIPLPKSEMLLQAFLVVWSVLGTYLVEEVKHMLLFHAIEPQFLQLVPLVVQQLLNQAVVVVEVFVGNGQREVEECLKLS